MKSIPMHVPAGIDDFFGRKWVMRRISFTSDFSAVLSQQSIGSNVSRSMAD